MLSEQNGRCVDDVTLPLRVVEIDSQERAVEDPARRRVQRDLERARRLVTLTTSISVRLVVLTIQLEKSPTVATG